MHLVPIRCLVLRPKQAAISSFAWWQPFYCSGFHHSSCGAINTVFDPSISYLPCSNRDSRGPKRSLTELCQKRNGAPSHTSFVCCLRVSTNRKPTVHAGGMRHKPSQQIIVCWHLDSTANLIDLTCPLMKFNELSPAQLHCGSPSADVSCTTSPVQANFTALSNARMEGSLSHRNTTLWHSKLSDYYKISSPVSHSLEINSFRWKN